jgi:elongation factor Ts
MTTTIEWIKQLREETHAGVLDCRRAFEEAKGDYAEALAALREQAEAEAAKRANRQASQGRIEMYSHGDGRIGVMVEINTETDFAGRSEILRGFAHEVALHIAAAAPHYLRDEEIPAEVLEEETQKVVNRARSEGKAESLIPRIVEGYLKKWMTQQVLLRQAYIRDDQITIAQLLSQAAAGVGENIVIRRFVRWELADGESNKF